MADRSDSLRQRLLALSIYVFRLSSQQKFYGQAACRRCIGIYDACKKTKIVNFHPRSFCSSCPTDLVSECFVGFRSYKFIQLRLILSTMKLPEPNNVVQRTPYLNLLWILIKIKWWSNLAEFQEKASSGRETLNFLIGLELDKLINDSMNRDL